MAILIVFVFIAVLILYGTWAWTYVIQKAWLWFVVPSFAGAEPITFNQALAISVAISLIVIRMPAKQSKSTEFMTPEEKIDQQRYHKGVLSNAILLPWFVLGMLWLVKWYFIG